MVWPFGGEHWCNTEGDHVHIVADLGHLDTDYEMSMCTLGLMGTRYIRDKSIPTEVNVSAGDSFTLTVPHIYSEVEIGTELAINIRTSSSTETIIIENQVSSTNVKIDASDLVEGDSFELTLDSYNTLSKVKSTLKKDVILVKVGPATESKVWMIVAIIEACLLLIASAFCFVKYCCCSKNLKLAETEVNQDSTA